MINFKKAHYFIVPKNFHDGDIEFDIFNKDGRCIGTNLTGVEKDVFETEADKFAFEELIMEETMKAEIEMKFVEEYGINLTDWKQLSIPADAIVETMDINWCIAPSVMESYLA